MKKILAIIMSTMVALSMLPAMAFAAEGESDAEATAQTASDTSANEVQAVSEDEDIDYYEDDTDLESGDWTFDIVNKKAVITGYDGDSSGTLTIPSTLKYEWDEDTTVSYEVTAIADYAYITLACDKLVIPSTIKSIGKDALLNPYWGPHNTLTVDCKCGSYAEEWALKNALDTTNGVTKEATTKATTKSNGVLKTTCKKCGKSGTHMLEKVKSVYMNAKNEKGSAGYAVYSGKSMKANAWPSANFGSDGYFYFLYPGVDYTLSGPSSVKNIGNYNYTITLKGFYSGTMKATLKVVPKNTSIKKLSKAKKAFTVKWKKQRTQTTGYQIRYSTNKSMKKAKTITVKGNKKTSKKIKKLKAKKTYYVQVRTYKTVKGKKYALPWYAGTAVKKVKTK